MKKSDIKELRDKDLQLRYYLGGLQFISNGKDQLCSYWKCDLDCTCSIVPNDERLKRVKEFIGNHGLTNERFTRLSYAFLAGYIMKYKGMYSPLFQELDDILGSYGFVHIKSGEIPNSDFREKELESIVNEPIVKKYLDKYKIDALDFITLGKTSLNINFPDLHIAKNPNDTFTSELCSMLDNHGFYVSREEIEEYREVFKTKKENARLVIDTMVTQKRYLQLMKELLVKDPDLANNLFFDELNELGINKSEDVKKLILSRKDSIN